MPHFPPQVPAHLEGDVAAKPSDFRAAFAFLEDVSKKPAFFEKGEFRIKSFKRSRDRVTVWRSWKEVIQEAGVSSPSPRDHRRGP